MGSLSPLYFLLKLKNRRTHNLQALRVYQTLCVATKQCDMPAFMVLLQLNFSDQRSVQPTKEMLLEGYKYHTTCTVTIVNNLESNYEN